ncbi:hypothetical protein [Cellulomonas aerilata]|uniref:Uncharacterized protein n=1 Tax=Cellulomonas aerilata TaxID=515326 RepID=A0A512DBI6_9CELL|nr:hypothetical protein [Cellulomonas aerilata]GEO33833.1 hypothetical protein CAE01nite_15580 [Cellulomonas aerilata]
MSSTSRVPPPSPPLVPPLSDGVPDGVRAQDGVAAPAAGGSAAPAVRAQLLATEHWSLLATRSTTWSEVMSRISIHLTVSSAALVVLALVAQATGFGGPFRVLSIGLASAVLVLGTLTGMRVMNASNDDAALVLGMNRLRAAYLEMDPGLSRYLVTSAHDDKDGVMATYLMGMPRSMPSHVLASTAMFMNVVNSIVAGTLGALVASAAGAPVAAVAVVGAGAGLGYLAGALEVGRRLFSESPVAARFPTPAAGRPGP